jgi:hypothetical protein
VVALWAQHGFVGTRIVRLFVEQRGVQDDPQRKERHHG